METNKFFKFLWRANAILIFFAAIGAIILLFTAVSYVISDLFHEDTPPPAIETVDSVFAKDETIRIRLKTRFEAVDNFTYFDLKSGEDNYGKFSSGSSSQRRNIVVYDSDSKTSHWVFENLNQEIESFQELKKTIRDDAGEITYVTKAFLLKVANSNVDGTIARNLWIMPLSGKNPKKIVSDIYGDLKLYTTDDDQLTLIIETSDGIDIYPVDLENLTLGQATTISPP